MFSSIELTMLRKVDTKLPVNLWIDENSEHKSRLMFQNNTSDTLTEKKRSDSYLGRRLSVNFSKG